MQPPRGPRPSIASLVLALALLVPLGLMAFSAAQLAGLNARLPLNTVYADASQPVASHPAPSNPAPPPTLAPPSPTPAPTLAPTTPTAVPTPMPRTYTVQRGDELKHIAAQYGVTIWTIIDANDIPNPDSLRVGQVLTIPNS
jgi:LysM repeat protein